MNSKSDGEKITEKNESPRTRLRYIFCKKYNLKGSYAI
jgi:hypothetical protein